ncbi:MAG: nicotinate phosphoribosyltransferase [Actinomycetota bacterium]|nr:nicotinate phosphoribosyltransferase [Actinomycetota bacterium]
MLGSNRDTAGWLGHRGVGMLDGGRRLGLMTDLYELRMADTCLRHGQTAPATFSLYVRPTRHRPWLLSAGTQPALELIERFRYGDEELEFLHGLGLSSELVDHLADFALSGEVWAVPDGTVVLGDEPLLEVTAPLPDAMLVETALLSVVQFTTLIATKAARCTLVADGRQLADFGARRAHGLQAGVEAARAAYLGGVDATSNVEAGRRHRIPVTGTMAHSFIQAWEDEQAAFEAFACDHPGNAVLLVDTYDTIEGVDNAITVGELLRRRDQSLDGVRLDSGDLAQLAHETRRMLDDAGFTEARIIASGGIDEWKIADLAEVDAPIDAFGVGTALTVSSDYPAFDIVYKLVEYQGRPRAKYSEGKVLLPGPKQVFRRDGPSTDVLARRDEPLPDGHQALLQPVWRQGGRLVDEDLEQVRQRAADQLDRLPATWRHPDGPQDLPRPRVSDELSRLADEVRQRDFDDHGHS